jgi:hypothetical protein
MVAQAENFALMQRKAMMPSVLNPTMWKTSLPMSMPIKAKGSSGVVHGLLLRVCDVAFADYPRGGCSDPALSITNTPTQATSAITCVGLLKRGVI